VCYTGGMNTLKDLTRDIDFLLRTVYDTFVPEWFEQEASWTANFLLNILVGITLFIWIAVIA
jgi:hypothetical protein